MKIGVAKEIKPDEHRVALTPAGARELTQKGHEVVVERGGSDLVLKVKEPLAAEFGRLREGLILFTYLHLAADEALTRALLDSGAICIAYETVETDDRQLPLLAPMSEVAGRLATQMGAWALEKAQGGRGILLGGLPGVPPAKVVVLGGGIVGYSAVLIAGARAPKLITREMLSALKPGAALVDVAIDQGGCFETSHPTTHSDP